MKEEEELHTANPIDPTNGKPIKMKLAIDSKDNISLRFCPDWEVERKRKRILIIKA